jgi:hypothetical protein
MNASFLASPKALNKITTMTFQYSFRPPFGFVNSGLKPFAVSGRPKLSFVPYG